MSKLRTLATAAVPSAFAALEAAAPAIGARWAERLWFTVPRGARPGPQPTAPGTELALTAAGTTIAGRAWGAAGHPVALLMHGWGGTKEQMSAFVDPLVAAGFEVVAIDGPSHGASGAGRDGPHRTTFLEFIEALEAVRTEFGPIDIVIAHSGGAMATVGALERGKLDANRLVFVAPFANVAPYTHVFAQRAGFAERTRRRMQRRIEQRIASRVEDWDIAAAAPRLTSTPLLLAHDTADTQAPAADSRAIADAWPGAELLLTQGLGHNRILLDPGVVAAVVRFATDRAAA